MRQEQTKPQDQETSPVSSDSTLYQEAVNEVADEYERSANSEQPTELVPATQKELGEVERALEDSVLGMDDVS